MKSSWTLWRHHSSGFYNWISLCDEPLPEIYLYIGYKRSEYFFYFVLYGFCCFCFRVCFILLLHFQREKKVSLSCVQVVFCWKAFRKQPFVLVAACRGVCGERKCLWIFCHFFEWNLNYKHFKIGNNKYEFDLKLNLTDRELKCQKYIYFDVHSAYIILDSATERLSVLFLYGLSLETFNITSQFFCWCVFPYFSPIFGERNSVSNWYFVLIEKYTWF